MNLILQTDSYKVTHWKQYPRNTETIYSYFESRGGEFSDVVFFGLQYYLKKYLEGFVVTKDHIDEAEDVLQGHLGQGFFNREAWEHIVNKHGGRLPVVIKAVPEGTVVPTSNVLMTIENTDPKCFWLTNYLETLLSQVWYGCTVATQSREMKKTILWHLKETGTPEDIDFKLHDFGFRGVSSVETAGIGSLAHLVNFRGTDTLEGITAAKKYYYAGMAGFSIPASEHSTITAWLSEEDAMENMLDQYPKGNVACVSDSFNIYRACSDIWGAKLWKKVMARDGTLVIRPDSGDPVYVVPTILRKLYHAFGGTINDKGYTVLDKHVRVIQGDGIDRHSIGRILTAMKDYGFSADNIAFGSGGALLQKLNRDTLKFAFKCSAAKVAGVWRDVYKDPINTPEKRSKRGRLKLVKGETKREYAEGKDELVEVFRDGEIMKKWTLEEVRKRSDFS